MFTSRMQISDQDVRTTASAKGGAALGQLAETVDGRLFVYALAGATNLAAGKLTQALATTANHVNQTGVAAAVGDTSIAYTLGATAAASDLYADGYFAVNDGPGPNVYRVVGNTNAASTNSYAVTVKLFEPLTVATTTSSKFSLYPNPYKSTVLYANSGGPGVPVSGVPNVAVTAANYYWSQVGGLTAVLSDGIIAKNAEGIPSNAVDGAVETRVDATVVKAVGYAPEATVDQKYYPFVLTCSVQ